MTKTSKSGNQGSKIKRLVTAAARPPAGGATNVISCPRDCKSLTVGATARVEKGTATGGVAAKPRALVVILD